MAQTATRLNTSSNPPADRRRFLRLLAALLLGAAVPFAYAPFGYALLAIIAPALFLLLSAGRPPRNAFALGYAFGFGMFGVGVNWVYISIHYYGHSPLPAAIAVMLLLVAFLALFPALLALLAARVRCSEAHRWLLLWPAGWILSEWVRSWIFTGFPWLALGYSQIDSPLAGYAPVMGVYGISGLAILSAGLFVWALRARRQARWLGPLVLMILWFGGDRLSLIAWTQATGAPLHVSLIQGNIPQEDKWEPAQQVATLERYVALTRSEWQGEPKADLVIWPETAIPAFQHQVQEDFILPLQDEARAAGSDLLTGVPVLDQEAWEYYNAVISLGSTPGVYFKHHLVPFGEYLPLRRWFGALLQVMPLPVADFSAGALEQPPLQAAGHPVGVSICYEIVFGEEIISKLPAAAFLVNVSNDAWFGDSLAPHQHLEMARMRARETGRYLLRATNTGISAILGPDGRVIERGPQFETVVVRGVIEPYAGATPYVRFGNLPAMIVALTALLLVWLRADRH